MGFFQIYTGVENTFYNIIYYYHIYYIIYIFKTFLLYIHIRPAKGLETVAFTFKD